MAKKCGLRKKRLFSFRIPQSSRCHLNIVMIHYYHEHSRWVGQWLWLSWQSDCFWNQRSVLRIKSLPKNNEHFFIVNCIEKANWKRKRGRELPIFNTLDGLVVDAILHSYVVNFFRSSTSMTAAENAMLTSASTFAAGKPSLKKLLTRENSLSSKLGQWFSLQK